MEIDKVVLYARIKWLGIWHWKRALMHIPVGLLTPFAGYYVHWDLAMILTIGFFAYEIMEGWRLKDHAYIDIQGWLIGAFLAGGAILMIVRLS